MKTGSLKVGKNPNDIFAPTQEASALTGLAHGEVIAPESDEVATQAGRGRPQVHLEPATKITTVLLNRHVVYLDGISNQIRGTSGAVLKRSEILRALVEALEAAAPDLTSVRSQGDLTEQLKKRLKQ